MIRSATMVSTSRAMLRTMLLGGFWRRDLVLDLACRRLAHWTTTTLNRKPA